MSGPYDNIREGAMNPPAGTAAGYENMLWDQLLGASRQEEQRYLQSLRDASNRAMERSGWYNVGSMLMPQDAGDVALSIAMGPGLGRGMRTALAALGGLTTQPGDAEGALLTRAWRMLNSGAAGARQAEEIAQHMATAPRVRDAVTEPTVQNYLDNMRNVLAPSYERGQDAAGRQLRMYEDPFSAVRGQTNPDWMLALNPQRPIFNDATMQRIAENYYSPQLGMRLPDALADTRMINRYPELEDMNISFTNNPNAAVGWFRPPSTGWQGAVGGSGQGAEIVFNGAHIPSWDRNLQRTVVGEEMQHALQWADNRIGPNTPALRQQWEQLPTAVQQTWQDFAPTNNPDAAFMRFYRGYPVEWEGGLAANRAATRTSVPRWDSMTDTNADAYWRLFQPERLP